jgi:hypothetical protein
LDEFGWESQREKRGDGASAHGGQIAESAGEGAVADGLCRVPVEAEVAAGDREVGGYGELFAGGGTKDGAVVADAETQLRSGGLGGAEANPVEEGQLAEVGRVRFFGRARHPMRIGYGAAGRSGVRNRYSFGSMFNSRDWKPMSPVVAGARHGRGWREARIRACK